MIGRICFAAMVFIGVVTAPVRAEQSGEPPVVVELYTSQGCSSCPPADAFLAVLAARDDVIALGFHVDYWDYIGWKDVFASPTYSARQKAYAKAAGRRSIYTPQMIIGGEVDVVGNHPMDVTDQIDLMRDRPVRVKLMLQRGSGDAVIIAAEAVSKAAQAEIAAPLLVQVIRYKPEAHVEITRGENEGHRLAYTNIVTKWDVLGEWQPNEPFKAQIAAPGDEPVVVLIQQKGPGRIEASAQLR